MKEKSAMSDKIFDFNKTKDALGQLSTDLIELETIIKIKRCEIEQKNKNCSEMLNKKEKIIADLTQASKDALTKIENITDFIDEVL